MKQVTIYTDGACSGNPGPGGWGAILMYGSHRRELSGGEAATTNNRMELTAVIRDGQKLPVTDQRYRLYVHLWCDLFYLRAAVLWCRDLPGRIKRKLCQ